MARRLSPGNLTILVAGVVMALGSFLPFYTFHSIHENAWGTRYVALLGPATLPAVLGAIMAAHVALTDLLGLRLPRRVLGFTWNQVHLLFGFQCTLMMFAWLVTNKELFSYGAGFILMLLSAIALFVGAGIRNREPTIF